MHLGEEMSGGKITVHGDVGSWAGSMMKNGTIEIHGNAGDYLAAPYRGSIKGMHGGSIIIHGNAGNEAGAHMKKGTIKIHGKAGQFVGLRMHDGTIHVRGDCDARAGACMIAGKIVIQGKLESILPSFTVDSIKPKVKIDENETAQGPFYVFLGDLAECGNGKLYVSKQNNPQLTIYDKFL
jgi:formylmethanofuran dehydrogenase subunit C